MKIKIHTNYSLMGMQNLADISEFQYFHLKQKDPEIKYFPSVYG